MDPVRDKTSEMFTDSHASRVSNGMGFFKRHIQWFYSLVLALFFVGGYTFTLAPPPIFLQGIVSLLRAAHRCRTSPKNYMMRMLSNTLQS